MPDDVSTVGVVYPEPGGLGTYTKFGTTKLTLAQKYSRTLGRYQLQEQARVLLPHERVASCLRFLIPQANMVEIWGDREKGVAHYRNLALCGSVWMCPVCAPNIAEQRRDELDRAVVEARSRGMVVALETLTARHHARDVLRVLLDTLLEARRSYVRGRAGKDACEVFGLRGRVTSLESTYRVTHSWHPHFHSLLFFDAGADLAAYEARMSRAWLSTLRHFGLDGNAHAYKLQATYGAVADYVQKWGHEAASKPWGVAAELTKWHVKRGRASESVTPFQLLELSQFDERAATLYREYAHAFKGRHQLHWSRGLRRELLGEDDELSDQEAAKGRAEDLRALLAAMLIEDWERVRANGARGEAVVAALRGGEAFREFLSALGRP